MERAVSLLVDWLVEPTYNELRRAFFEWLSRVFLPVHFPGVDFSKIDELSEVKNILDVLNDRFGSATLEIADKLQAIEDPIRLKNLHRKAIQIPSIQDFSELLK